MSKVVIPSKKSSTLFGNGQTTIIQASAFHIPLKDESVQCIVTSPPYFNLRKYLGNSPDAFGQEKTIAEYIQHSVDVLRECRRVLGNDGVAFWNIGDSYSGSSKGNGGKNAPKKGCGTKAGATHAEVPTKNLCLIPNRIAIAAQEDGWWVRDQIIWYKPNTMPESVEDRCTRSYEVILMLTKQRKYYFDSKAIEEPAVCAQQDLSKSRHKRNVWFIPTRPHEDAHIAMFPEEIPRLCIKAASKKGQTVLDPFAGSGTTGIVANELGRNAVLVEISSEYVKLMKERFKALEDEDASLKKAA